MNKVKRLFSAAFALMSLFAVTLLGACAKNTTISVILKSNDTNVGAIITIIIAVLVVLAFVALILLKFKKKKSSEEEAEESEIMTQDPNAVSEYISDEEREAMRKAAEEEKAAQEETPAEKAQDEGEKSPEETPAEEKVAEEPEKEVVEEVAEITSEDKADITKAEREAESLGYTLDENGFPIVPEGMVVRYKWSFLGRLIQSDDELKYRYMLLRRKLLSYKKVRSNVSWNFDSYFIGRNPIVKLKVRGKTLVAYFPFDPKEMEGSKYIGEDVSDISRYKAVPFAYRINGMRKLKYAMELIERQLVGVKSKEPEAVDESRIGEIIPYESFRKLFLKGYIRIGGVIEVGARASSQDDDDDDIEVDENENDAEVAPSELKEEFNFNPKPQS